MSLRAIDTHGKPFIRALLREGAQPDSLVILGGLLAVEHATFTLGDVAREIGVHLPPPAPFVQEQPRPRAVARKSRRAA